MIPIKKGREPASLTQYKQQRYASYDDFPHKDDLELCCRNNMEYARIV